MSGQYNTPALVMQQVTTRNANHQAVTAWEPQRVVWLSIQDDAATDKPSDQDHHKKHTIVAIAMDDPIIHDADAMKIDNVLYEVEQVSTLHNRMRQVRIELSRAA